MRVTIEVNDMTTGQWSWLNANLPASREFGPDTVRMCVTLATTDQTPPVHVELPPREFIAIIGHLATIDNQTVLPGPACEHGSPVVRETPSAFRGAQPIRTYADGCQSYGPYASIAEQHHDPDFADRLTNGAYER